MNIEKNETMDSPHTFFYIFLEQGYPSSQTQFFGLKLELLFTW